MYDWDKPYTCGACDYFTYEGPNTKGKCTKIGAYYYPDESGCSYYSERRDLKTPGTGSSSSAGSSSVCFITNAYCKHKGLADNCYALQTIRHFRDSWLAKQDNGKSIINTYYNDAPKIVEAIEKRADKADFYDKIYHSLQDILNLIEAKENENSALLAYLRLKQNLENELLLKEKIV